MPYSGRIRNPSTLQRLILEPYGDFRGMRSLLGKRFRNDSGAVKSGQSILTYQG
jgi:hypothetical protein